MRCLIIHNLDSGFGSDAVFEFERSLVRHGDEVLLRAVGDGFSPDEVTRDAEGYDVVVVSGGDGTVAAILYALRGRNVRTCIFPSGTANLMFANLGCALEPAALARACRAGRCATTDLGETSWTDADGQPHTKGFSLMCGTGYDAELMQAAIPNKRAMGEAAYFMAAFNNLNPPVLTFTIDIDGRTEVRQGIACLVANNAMIQADIEIVPDCVMDDGLLDVIVLEADLSVQLLKPLVRGLVDRSGKVAGRPHIESFKGADVHITSSAAIPLQIDGDVVADAVTSYETHVLPAANRLVVDQMARYGDGNCGEDLFPDADEQAFPEL
ncbi:MAG: diacylglycerol kinase [Atopobiaceae bacterium]|jgi:diacylglycerol kinase family enzyme|nr:diacylglycerol kinase [Atopobiaceae bacterium]MCH4180124.1 diacylglycerol kinase [Atopobiaceae bacterium]MCH4213824.1 diacylglycerol kinase [Atopobiaceae bacterium]MCH4229926.1 diacylglycerol kinase [Atopobiaceae bacterium]MCH4275713.1 diacylglycerol kinase [Atopobiaceae bacterium]